MLASFSLNIDILPIYFVSRRMPVDPEKYATEARRRYKAQPLSVLGPFF